MAVSRKSHSESSAALNQQTERNPATDFLILFRRIGSRIKCKGVSWQWAFVVVLVLASQTFLVSQDEVSALGLFDGHEDVGFVLHPGSATYDASKRRCTLSGSGENIWFTTDAFQFAWKKVTGDVTLTASAKGLDDGPEYEPDGSYIYFNSERTGSMQIWRMRSDGSEQERITFDDFNN